MSTRWGRASRGPLAGRHRHAEDVRSDGLAVVLGPLLQDARITAVVLADVHSGMVLDACTHGPQPWDLEMLGARHAELARVGYDVVRGEDGAAPGELVISRDDRFHHVLRTVPDPHGDHLVLSAVVRCPRRQLRGIVRRLRTVPTDALTAGPSLRRRPVGGAWSLAGPMWTSVPDHGAPPATAPFPAGWDATVPQIRVDGVEGSPEPPPSPPSAMPSRR